MMRTWSLAEVCDEAKNYARAIVAPVLAPLLDAVFPPLTHDYDEADRFDTQLGGVHVADVPGCPNVVVCRELDCQGDCSEAWPPYEYYEPCPRCGAKLRDDELPSTHVCPLASPADAVSQGAGPAAVEETPVPPAAGIPLAVWLEPAVMTVLDKHMRVWDADSHVGYCDCAPVGRTDRGRGDYQAWLEHVAPLTAAHIAKAIPDFPGDLPEK